MNKKKRAGPTTNDGDFKLRAQDGDGFVTREAVAARRLPPKDRRSGAEDVARKLAAVRELEHRLEEARAALRAAEAGPAAD